MGSAKRKSSQLDARKLALYEMAYNLALASPRGYGWRPDDPQRSDEVKKALARSILEKIVSGETDPDSKSENGPWRRFFWGSDFAEGFSQSVPSTPAGRMRRKRSKTSKACSTSRPGPSASPSCSTRSRACSDNGPFSREDVLRSFSDWPR